MKYFNLREFKNVLFPWGGEILSSLHGIRTLLFEGF
jgi:hypothetical protein